MKENDYKYLTMFLLIGFITGAFLGILAWLFTHNIFCIPIGTGIGVLVGIVIGATIDDQKKEK